MAFLFRLKEEQLIGISKKIILLYRETDVYMFLRMEQNVFTYE